MQLKKIEFIKFITKIGIRDKFYKNLGKNRKSYWRLMSYPHYMMSMAVILAFDWMGTQEGYAFWFRIHKLWERLCAANTLQEKNDIYHQSYDFVKTNLKQS